MELRVVRDAFYEDTTMGKMFINGVFFGFTLEDKVRPKKIKGETAIDSGEYEVVLSMSPRFKRIMPEILNVPNFVGVRIHGGNTHKDTEGCILVARNRNDKTRTIQGTLEKDLINIMGRELKRGGFAKLIIEENR